MTTQSEYILEENLIKQLQELSYKNVMDMLNETLLNR
jgi:hypothetical protein